MMVSCSHELSIWHHIRDIPHLRFRSVTLTFQTHWRSNILIFVRKVNVLLHNDLLSIRTLYHVPFARYSSSKNSVSDLDLSDSLKDKYFNFIEKSRCYFIMIFCRYESHYLQDIPHLRIRLVIHIFLEFFWHNFCVFFKIILENNKKVRLKLLQIICIYDIIMQSI